jgi:S1-C subfamily serine protease
LRYINGEGVPQDDAEAVKWYRKAADQGDAVAQNNLGACYDNGQGVPQDHAAAVRWFRSAAEQGFAGAQYGLGVCYANGRGVPQDDVEAVKWWRKAAEQGDAQAQHNLGCCYANGQGVSQDYVEAVRWYRKAAAQGFADAQANLGVCYANGQGVPQNYVEAYKWFNLAAAQGQKESAKYRDSLAVSMTPEQIAEGQRRAAQFVARPEKAAAADQGSQRGAAVTPKGNGTGFFVASGYVLTSYHVVKDADSIDILSGGGRRRAWVVKVDPANDLALLEDLVARLKEMRAAKAGGTVTNVSAALPILSSRDVHLGDSVFTLGFPNTEVQGIEPKLTRGEINSLSGIQDDLRFFQISAPVQPGNSGGPLVDARGNVIGIVEARLDDLVALETSGALPQNVNYALKSSFLIAFLDSVPELAGKLKEPHTEKDRPFDDVVKEVQRATVMVIVY